tara:strand:- start:387 stop:1337 length:951 start_codon:yes stop_codon:yes gene_type:complete
MTTQPIIRLFRVLKPVVPLVVTCFIGQAIYENWQHVREATWEFEWAYLLLSFLAMSGLYVLRPLAWRLILQHFGHNVSAVAAYRIVRQAELSRYVPGAIWQYVSRVDLASRWGVSATATMAAALVETVILILSAVIPALLNFEEVLPNLARFQIVLLVLFPLGAVAVLQPHLLNFCMEFLSRKLNQPYSKLQIKWSMVAGIWLAYVLMWTAGCLGVGFFVRGVIEISFEQVFATGSFFAAAWIVAIISIVSPAGVGIRDGIFGLLLSQILPLGAALTIAVGVRMWMTLMELFWTALGVWFVDVPYHLTTDKNTSHL